MAIENKVSFVAYDRGLQHIGVIRVQRPDGSQVEYRNPELKLPEFGAQPERTMDCMDCHNRPTHIFQSPEGAVDQVLASGNMSPKLPWVKKVAVDALLGNYPDREAARAGIRERITGFYRAQYLPLLQSAAKEIEQAVETTTAIHERNVFPTMKVNWSTYPMNIGHRNWPGCFRCHDGKHRTPEGKALTTECTDCHTLPQRGPLSPLGVSSPQGSRDWHPWELKGKHAELQCHRCHAAGIRTADNCVVCHQVSTAAPMMRVVTCGSCHVQEGKRPSEVCGTLCHVGLGGLHAKAGHKAAPCTRCHQPHTWKARTETVCGSCHVAPREVAAGAWVK
jgi:hypothetical protein